MLVTAHTLAKIAGRQINDNMVSTSIGLQMAGIGAGLEKPHRLAMFLGQLAHESMGWRYDREIWGPTAAQKRYEGRDDLGNTEPGDGARFRGRGPIQLTGRYNYSRFTVWAQKMSADAPDFTKTPDAINSNPWEGLSPVWYWEQGNPTGESLNRFSDDGDCERVTRLINGGLNGYADRQTRHGRAALILMGRDPDDVKSYQRDRGLGVDGAVGPKTIAEMHRDLEKLPPVRFSEKPAVSETLTKPDITPAAKSGGVIAALVAVLAKMFGGKS